MADTRDADLARGYDERPPLISVIMPAHNAASYVEKAIRSVLTQTLSDLELIVFLDDPTDGTRDIVHHLAKADGRMRVIDSDTNVGVGEGLNRAATEARARFLARMDADDISVPQRFERQLAMLMANPSIAVVGSDAIHIDANDRPLGLSMAGPRSIAAFERMRANGEVTLVLDGTAMMRREVFDTVGGYDPSMPIAVEVDLHSRMAEHGAIVSLSEALLMYRLHADSRVSTRFFEGRSMHRFVEARNKALIAGAAPLSYQDYLAKERVQPIWKRSLRHTADLGRFHYRRAGLRAAEHRGPAAAVNLLMALVMNPSFVVRRVWERRLSPAARREISTIREWVPAVAPGEVAPPRTKG